MSADTRVKVMNIPQSVNEGEIQRIFEEFGNFFNFEVSQYMKKKSMERSYSLIEADDSKNEEID